MQVEDSAVHVWIVPLTASPVEVRALWHILPADERRRAECLRVQQQARRFVVARGQLRRVLSKYVGRQPDEVRFGYEALGRPYLLGFEGQVEFNIAHCRDLALVAVHTPGGLGIDVEQVRSSVNISGLARRFFARSETDSLDQIAPEERVTAFFRTWTCKEAYLKARRIGLSAPLRNFEVAFNANGGVRVSFADPAAGVMPAWWLHSFVPEPGYIAALCCDRPVGAPLLRSVAHELPLQQAE